ncbi:hypothetical protein I4U23_025186, partial [Adineta vaga]
MPFVYHLHSGHTLSIQQLHHALQLTINKHPSLHTSLTFDTDKNLLVQRVIDFNSTNNSSSSSSSSINHSPLYTFIETVYESEEQLNGIMYEEKRNPQLFNLAQGLVFRCHLLHYKQISSNGLLSEKDVIIFNFHHALFDFPSMNVFLRDLNQAYTAGQLTDNDDTSLRYLDYAIIEQQMPMTDASMFWLDALHNCKLDQSLPLPYDRHRLSNEHRTGRGTSITFEFGQDLSDCFLNYALLDNISLKQLALATYYIFLFKLTNGETDLCVGMNTPGRYRDELNSVIGMFVNAIPLRCQLDPKVSFQQLLEGVVEVITNCTKYSYFPLQRILAQHPNVVRPAFLDISFDFLSYMMKEQKTKITIGSTSLSTVPFSIKINEDEIMSKFDFVLSIEHDLKKNSFFCTINASLDLFKVETVSVMAQRFLTILDQLFLLNGCQTNKSMCEISVALPNERLLIQSINNTQLSYSETPCISHAFVSQTMKHPQKLAVELDDQSLTYAELLHYVQILSLHLLNIYHIVPGDIICQCVERSLAMVIGVMAIEMIGGVYCPLSPRDPEQRLHALVEQTHSRLVLVHHMTKLKFHNAFDRTSRSIFFKDLYHAYNNNSIWFDEEKSLQYIDYSVHERLIDMTPSREFWRSQLAGYHVEHSLALPVDRRRSLSEQRSGASCVVQTSFDKEISASFLEYASSHQVTPFQLGLATFYAFLFKLTHGDNDICVSALNANRYRPELQNIMGMFVATLPHRIHLDKQLTFHELVRVVHETCLAILEHSYYPLQQILTDRRLNQSPIFLTNPIVDQADAHARSLTKYNLILPEEDLEIQKQVFCRQLTVINEAPASYAQTRLSYDEKTPFHPDQSSTINYNMPFLYQLLPKHTLSIKRLRQALELLVIKHESFRTSLILPQETNILIQKIVDPAYDKSDLFKFLESTYETIEQLNDIITSEKENSKCFDLPQGLVFRCHLIYYKHISDNDILSGSDRIIFNFHHAVFDIPSMNIFLRDLNEVYTIGQLPNDDNDRLRYIDYTIIEQQMPMTGANMFWLDALQDCHLDRSQPLPYDRHRLSNENRTGHSISTSFDFGHDLSYEFLAYTSSHNISLRQLTLTVYYAFLYKLTNEETDICVVMNVNNRYRDELKSIIGLFENIIPLRCQVDPHWSFHQLIQHVCEIEESCVKYSYLPFQRIVNQHANPTGTAFLNIFFHFQSSESQHNQTKVMIGDARLYRLSDPVEKTNHDMINQFDFLVFIEHNASDNRLSCTIKASLDLFSENTVSTIAHRFHCMIQSMVHPTNDQMTTPIYELSFRSPNDELLMQSVNNTEMKNSSVSCIHHEFVRQVIAHPQKLAVELDEQSLTYSELLHSVQVLSLRLLNEYRVVPNEIICQCLERSLAMVIGMMAIEMIGGVYCPLSPRDPEQRLYALVQQTNSRLVLVHSSTINKFPLSFIILDIDILTIRVDLEDVSSIVQLSNIIVTPDNIAYIIFTSGSTGIPKA